MRSPAFIALLAATPAVLVHASPLVGRQESSDVLYPDVTSTTSGEVLYPGVTSTPSSSAAAASETATVCGWQCLLPSDSSPVATLSTCSSSNLTCICPPLAKLSPTCLDCHLTLQGLTYAQYLSDCVYPLETSSGSGSVKATGTGNVILGANATASASGGGSTPTSLAKASTASPMRNVGWLGVDVGVGVGLAVLAAAVMI